MAVKRMQQRQDTSANWTSANPVLLAGEIGYETDTKKSKMGDGSTSWNDLGYNESIRIGTVVYTPEDTKDSYLRCDGSSYLLTAYPELGALIGSVDSHTYTTTVAGVDTSGIVVSNWLNDCSFSPDGSYLAVGHSSSPYLTIIRTSDWTEVSGTPTLPSNGYGCSFSPDGSYLAVAHYDSPCLTIIRTSDTNPANWTNISGTPTLQDHGYGCSFSPDGSYLAVVHGGSPYLIIVTGDTIPGTEFSVPDLININGNMIPHIKY